MSSENDGGGAPKRKSGRSWLRDAAFFCAGLVTGSAGTIGFGLASGAISSEDLPGGGGGAASNSEPFGGSEATGG